MASKNTTAHPPELVAAYGQAIADQLLHEAGDEARLEVSLEGRTLRATYHGITVTYAITRDPAREEVLEHACGVVGKGLLGMWEAHLDR